MKIILIILNNSQTFTPIRVYFALQQFVTKLSKCILVAVYGNGVYFARDSWYSAHNQYSKPNQQLEKLIIQSRVIVGAEVIKGKEGLRAAPYKDQQTQYDCVVDNVATPGIYVVFNDASAYPEYIIKFKLL